MVTVVVTDEHRVEQKCVFTRSSKGLLFTQTVVSSDGSAHLEWGLSEVSAFLEGTLSSQPLFMYEC